MTVLAHPQIKSHTELQNTDTTKITDSNLKLTVAEYSEY